MFDTNEHGSGDTLYELGKIALFFGGLGVGLWTFLKLMLRSNKRESRNRRPGVNRQPRGVKRAMRKGKNSPR